MNKILPTLALGGLTLGALSANAALLFSDDFSYSPGDLFTQSGHKWYGTDDAGNHPVMTGDGTATVDFGDGSWEDVGGNIVDESTPITSGTIYYALKFNVMNTTPEAATAYFVAFSLHQSNTNMGLGGRLFVEPSSGSDYALGVSDASTVDTNGVTWGTGFNYGDYHTVVIGWDQDNGVSQMWVDPENMSSMSITDNAGTSTPIDGGVTRLYLRQSGENIGTIKIDSIAAATDFDSALGFVAVPEPSTYAAFAGILGLGLALFRRRRKVA